MTVIGVVAAILVILLSTVRESWTAQESAVGPAGGHQGLPLPRWVDLALLLVAMGILLPRLWGLLT